MAGETFDIGMVGLGTMGRNLAFNMTDHGFSVAGFDKSAEQAKAFGQESGGKKVFAAAAPKEFVQSLKTPRVIILLVPAGNTVDLVIDELLPLLSADDLLLDCGNSHFTDTDRRIERLKLGGVHFMGVGISGGESGARHGPSIMPGGPKEVYERVKKLFAAIAAKVEEEPCAAWLGPGSAGHYVKMVHNGIEYALMQLIAEAYHVLKRGGLSNAELHEVFKKWNSGKLRSFLIGITADIFTQRDELTEHCLLDMILDTAHQKGTGSWTSEDALRLQVPVPVIDLAVSMRGLSAYKKERMLGEQKLKGSHRSLNVERNKLQTWLEEALYFATIVAYAQGLELLQAASKAYGYELRPERVAKIWRGGCIIRAALLDDIYTVFSLPNAPPNLMLSDHFAHELALSQKGIRSVVRAGASAGIPLPALMGSLAYYDSCRSGWLPANLLQAQRDYFGAHTYERTDREGTFHTHWNTSEE